MEFFNMKCKPMMKREKREEKLGPTPEEKLLFVQRLVAQMLLDETRQDPKEILYIVWNALIE